MGVYEEIKGKILLVRLLEAKQVTGFEAHHHPLLENTDMVDMGRSDKPQAQNGCQSVIDVT